MKLFISILTIFGYVSAIIAIVFIIRVFVKKATYYPSSMQNEVTKKISHLLYIAGFFGIASMACFFGGERIIVYDFKKTLREHKIVAGEFNDVFFSKEDINGVFDNFESTEGRYKCEAFTGFIDLDNGESIPVKVIRHCYEKNRYIIISKKYDLDATIGDIRTSKFDDIKIDSSIIKSTN